MICYFTGTGNTRWLAQQLAEATGERLVSMAAALYPKEGQPTLDYTLTEGERLGFCFPTHGWQPPAIVRRFIREATFNGTTADTFVYALTTCGDSAGDVMTILNRELAKKGLQAETLFSVIMPESYVCLPFMYTDSDERAAEKIANARRQAQHICRIVKERRRGLLELEKGPTPRLYSYVIGGFFNHCLITDSKFTVDVDRCTRCGKCQRVCPVGNIECTPPRWLHDGRCTCCLACYHHCPEHAINYGPLTHKRGQYTFEREKGKGKSEKQ